MIAARCSSVSGLGPLGLGVDPSERISNPGHQAEEFRSTGDVGRVTRSGRKNHVCGIEVTGLRLGKMGVRRSREEGKLQMGRSKDGDASPFSPFLGRWRR